MAGRRLVVLGACFAAMSDRRFLQRFDWVEQHAGSLAAKADASVVIPVAAIAVVALLVI